MGIHYITRCVLIAITVYPACKVIPEVGPIDWHTQLKGYLVTMLGCEAITLIMPIFI